jgi:hypothetical protein
MSLENLVGADKYISNLVVGNPTGGDDKREGDDHIRGIKNVLKNSFPMVNGVATPAKLGCVDRTGDTMTGPLLVPAGTVAAPGLAVGAADWGLTAVGGKLAFSVAGAQKGQFSNAAQGEFSVNVASTGGWSIANRGLVNIDGAAGGLLGLSFNAARIGYLGSGVADLTLGTSQQMPILFKISGVEVARVDDDNTLKYGGQEVGFRGMPVKTTAFGYTLTRAERGGLVIATAGSLNITTAAIFVAGDVINIVNKGTANIGIVATGITLNWGTGTPATGNRVLAVNGTATLWFTANNVATLTGSGIT